MPQSVSGCFSNLQLCMFSARNVNLTVPGTVLLGTTANGARTFTPLFVSVKATAIEAPSSNPLVSVGTVAGGYEDILTTGSLLMPDIVNQVQTFFLSEPVASPGNTQIFLDVGSPASATLWVAEVDLIGFYS
jgi:hypothetical protein